MIELPFSALNHKFQQEVNEIDSLPLNIDYAPVLIITKAGSFELAWDLDKKVLMIWVSNGTWKKIEKIVEEVPNTNNYSINLSKRTKFFNEVKLLDKYTYLGSYPTSVSHKVIREPEETKQILENGFFGKWVELAYLLPSYIPIHFGLHLELAESKKQKEDLALIQGYAEEARKFFNQRGKLIGYGVGDSGLWLEATRIFVPSRNFRLIWGLGGRSDFFFRTQDNSVECWDLKTISPNKKVIDPNQQLTKIDSLKQVIQQAPSKLNVPSTSPLGVDILPVTAIGVLGVGREPGGSIISRHEIVPPLSEEKSLIEYPENFSLQQDGVLNRPVRTARLEQLAKQLTNPIRFELAAQILEESVSHLVDVLTSSSEWDSIQKALDGYYERKCKSLQRFHRSK